MQDDDLFYLHGLEVGHMLVAEFGPNPGNVEFFVVVGVVGKYRVDVRRCGGLVLERDEHEGKVIPNADERWGEVIECTADDNGSIYPVRKKVAEVWNGLPLSFEDY